MSFRSSVPLALILLGTSCGAPSRSDTPEADATRAAEAVIRILYASVERFDGGEVRALLTRDFELTEPNRGIRWDRNAFAKMVESLEGRGTLRYTLDEFFTEHYAGAVAYTGYRNRMVFEAAPESPLPNTADETIEFAVQSEPTRGGGSTGSTASRLPSRRSDQPIAVRRQGLWRGGGREQRLDAHSPRHVLR